jgi:hypothetical protein
MLSGTLHKENVLSKVAKAAAQQKVDETHPHSILATPRSGHLRAVAARVSDGFRCRFPKLTDLMDEAEEDMLSYAAFFT